MAAAAEGLGALQERLAQLQLAQIVHRQRAIILFEGWEGSGRRTALRRLAAAWDPCQFATHCGGTDDKKTHWLAPFWGQLPTAGRSALYSDSWYRQIANRRSGGELTDKAWARRCDEINEFEAQQRDQGTLIIKLFFHISEATQMERLAALRADPWQRWLTPSANSAPRASSEAIWTDLLTKTDTRWAPWTVVDANGPSAGQHTALATVAGALEKVVPLDPPSEKDAPMFAGESVG